MTPSDVTTPTSPLDAAAHPIEHSTGVVTSEGVEARFTPPEIARMFPSAKLSEQYLRAACDRKVAALPCIRTGQKRLIALSTLNKWLREEEVRNVG